MSVPPPVYLIAGAPAVGKSTTARALAASQAKSIHIPVDTLREMVISGLALPGLEWGPALIEQLAAARASACAMARVYHAAGYAVVVDDFYDPHSGLAEYRPLWDELPVRKVLLYPEIAAALARNLERSGPGQQSDYIAAGIGDVYGHLRMAAPMLRQAGWQLLDTTTLSVSDAVRRILTSQA